MAITLEALKTLRQDYLLAHWENGELVMEPSCSCGNMLEDDYFCKACGRKCDCTFIACGDTQALSIVEKLIHGNPNFKKFTASLLGK
jgi:hypothetical protein